VSLRSFWSATFVAAALVFSTLPTGSGAVAADRAARPAVACDGTWHIVNTPVRKTHATQSYGVAAVSGTDAWAVGSDQADPSSGYPSPRAEHWDGAAWTVVKTPLPSGAIGGSLQGVSVVSSSNVWAVGWYKDDLATNIALIEHWNGSKWKLVSSGLLGADVTANAVDALSANDIWLVGIKGVATRLSFTAHWDGSTWKSVTSPNQNGSVEDFLYSVSATSSTDVWATGAWTDSSTSHGLTQHWDGAAWKIVKPKAAFTLNGSAGISANEAWAAGYDAGWTTLIIEKWNGTKWATVPVPPTSQPTVGGLSAAASDDVWLAGTTFGRTIRNVLMLHWDGGSWVEVPSETPATQVAVDMAGVSVTANGSTAFAAGTYWKTESSFPQTVIEMWC
jgi:hypothetical protein